MQKAESLDRGNNHPNQQLTIITSHSGLLVQGIIIENQESESVMLRWLHLLWLASSHFHVALDAWGIYFRWCCSWHSYTTWKEKKIATQCHIDCKELFEQLAVTLQTSASPSLYSVHQPFCTHPFLLFDVYCLSACWRQWQYCTMSSCLATCTQMFLW